MTAIDTYAPSAVRFAAETVFGSLRAFWRRRQQRLAIACLLDMDASRLDDLGITTGDVRDALRARDAVGAHLVRRRASRKAA